MIFKINPAFTNQERKIRTAFQNFDNSGNDFMNGERNIIKIFEIDNHLVNIKSFKIPNLLNQIVYRFFRKSKAMRSFEFAGRLIEKGIGTPVPIAFQENHSIFGLKNSFYASIHQDYDLTFRELVEIPDYPNHENILRQFTRFCFQMHQSGIEFKDHSPGNTLIKKQDDQTYEFYLVDLNRMNFHETMSVELRMKNLSHLTPKKEMVRVMADEYAKVSAIDRSKLFELLWIYTDSFQRKYHQKQNTKKKLKSIFK